MFSKRLPPKHYPPFHKYDMSRECFKWDYRYIRIGRVLILLFNVVLAYFILKEIGLKAIGIFIGIFIIFHLAKDLFSYLYLSRFEKRILKPLAQLQKGVEQVARGSYNVKIEYDNRNELGFLIESFNNMAQKLEESENLKREYEENRKSLIANISHDLKTPISSIQGYVEAICEGSVTSPEKVRRYLEIVYANTKYVNKLIDDLFLFSRLDIQKVDFNFEIVPLKAFMGDLFQELSLELAEKKVRLNYRDELGEECYGSLDGKRINQAVRNIAGNSVKYGPPEGLLLNVVLQREDSTVHLVLKDNGPGIPAEKAPHIFERFYRIEPERTKDEMSTGLGLAISREIIEAHGGRIEVITPEQQGACFRISLPVKDKDEELNSVEKPADY